MKNKLTLALAFSITVGVAQGENTSPTSGYSIEQLKTAQKATAALSAVTLPVILTNSDLQPFSIWFDNIQESLSRATESDVLLQKVTRVSATAGTESLKAYKRINGSKFAGKSAHTSYTEIRNQCILNAASKISLAALEEVVNTLVCVKVANKIDNRLMRRALRAGMIAANKTILKAADQLICEERMSESDHSNALEKLKTDTMKYFADLGCALAKNAAIQAVYEVIGEAILRSADEAGTIAWLSQEKEKAISTITPAK